MSYAVSMGHGSPRSFISRRWWMRTRFAGLACVPGPVPYGAATSGFDADVIVYRPSLEAHAVWVPGYLWMAYDASVSPSRRSHTGLRRASQATAGFGATCPRATGW